MSHTGTSDDQSHLTNPLRIIERGNRVTATCDCCDWTNTSTGPQALKRVRKQIASHVTSATHLRLSAQP